MALEPRTLLVTGGAGFIASTFVAQAVARGQKVVVLDALTYAGHRANLEWIAEGPGSWELVVGSITDRALVDRLMREHRFDAVLNFAAESHVDNSIASSAPFIDTNIVGTHVMLEAARHYWNALEGEARARFRYLQVSTDEVYGSLGDEGHFTEDSPYRPNSPYSASKAGGDMLVRAWHETYGLPTLITNCSNNYGPRQFPEKLIPVMITRALEGRPMPVYGDGQNVRDWIHVEDHCRGIYLALTKGVPGETYCFGGHAEMPNLALVTAIADTLDELAPRAGGAPYRELIAFVTDRPGHDRRYAIDDRKAQQALGYAPEHTLASGLKATVAWYLANGGWCETVLRKAA